MRKSGKLTPYKKRKLRKFTLLGRYIGILGYWEKQKNTPACYMGNL